MAMMLANSGVGGRSLRTGMVVLTGAGIMLAGAGQALAAPISPTGLDAVPARTAITFNDSRTGWSVGTANQHEARAGLSTVKLYMADYVLKYGDATDYEDAQRMVEVSDDGAASRLHAKYPDSINGPAREYGLTATHDDGFWGDATTSTADTVRFLEEKKLTDPESPVLGWMRTAAPVAADGTAQNWGTARLPGALGTKWGWSDDGVSAVNSATIGMGYSVAASTYGPPDAQTQDVRAAFSLIPVPGLDIDLELYDLVTGSLE